MPLAEEVHEEKILIDRKALSPGWVLGISVLAASTASIFIRYAQQEASSFVIAFYRLCLATLVLAPFAFTRYRGELRSLAKRQWLLVFLSGFFLALHFATWITSLEWTDVASSVVLVSISPLIVALLSTILLRERLRLNAWIGLAIALCGSVLVAFSEKIAGMHAGLDFFSILQGEHIIGNSLALAGAVFVAGYLIIGRKLRASLSLVPYAFLVFGSAALVLLLLITATGQKMTGFSSKTYLFLVLLAVIPQLLGHASFNWVLRYVPAALVSIALLGEPIGSSILAVLFLHEIPSCWEVVGGIMILAGIFLTSRAQKLAS